MGDLRKLLAVYACRDRRDSRAELRNRRLDRRYPGMCSETRRHAGFIRPSWFDEWRAHVLERLRRQVDVTAAPSLARLLDELRAYPAPPGSEPPPRIDRQHGGVLVPLRLKAGSGTLSFFGPVTVLGAPTDITLSELAIEAFFPADAATAEAMLRMAASPAPTPSAKPPPQRADPVSI